MSVRNFVQFFISKKNFISSLRIMANVESIEQLQTRAEAAESLIAELRADVGKLQEMTVTFQKNVTLQNQAKYNEIKLENEKLRKEIEVWKNRLIAAENKGNSNDNSLSAPAIKTESSPKPAATKAKSPTPESAAKISEQRATEKEKKEPERSKKEKAKAAAPTEKKGAKTTDSAAAGDDQTVDVSKLDFKVGKIVSVKKHPDADSLYVEEVDVGEGKTRQVVSGLVKFVPIEEMQGRMVVLLCNLKPAKMRGVTSEAMVMCASTPEKVEVLIPPPGSQPGDLVHFEGYGRTPEPVLNPKKKIFETCAPDLKTDANKIATYKGVPFTVPGKGPVTTASLSCVNIK